MAKKTNSHKPWTAEEMQLLSSVYADSTPEELLRLFPSRTIKSIYCEANLLGLRKSREYLSIHSRIAGRGTRHRFPKGNVPHNKGMKGWNAGGRSSRTRFSKGNKPQTWKPIGYTRIDSEGYTYIKVKDGKGKKNFKPAHVHLWEQHNRPIPAGYIVVFKDKDKTNITIQNLEFITRSDLVKRNSLSNQSYPDELKQIIRLIAGLSHRITIKRRGRCQKL